VEAFRLEAMDYLLKPLDRGRLAETIDRARRVILEKKSSEPAAARAAAPVATPRTKLMVKAANRNFIVDASDVIYATIDSGLITLVTTSFEGQSNYRTIEDLQANLDRELFWRVHRSYLVNINRIKEVAVSYTHLDVYKRQSQSLSMLEIRSSAPSASMSPYLMVKNVLCSSLRNQSSRSSLVRWL